MIAINGSREFILTSNVLLYETVPIETFPRNIIYKITNPTKYGNIYVEGSRKYAKVSEINNSLPLLSLYKTQQKKFYFLNRNWTRLPNWI